MRIARGVVWRRPIRYDGGMRSAFYILMGLTVAACESDSFSQLADDAAVDVERLDASDAPVDTTSSRDATDAGDTGVDTSDGSVCTVLGQDPPAFATSCTTGNPVLVAGVIPNGAYSLTVLRDFASDCTNFVSVQASGLLQIAAQGSNKYLIEERVTVDGVVSHRHYVGTVSGPNMTVTLTCGPAILNPIWQLYVSVQGGKTQLVVLKQSAPNNQRYFWVEQ